MHAFAKRLGHYVLFAVQAGLIVGLCEAGAVAVRVYLLDGIVRLNLSQMVWMAPLGDALFFGLGGATLGTIVLGLERQWPGFPSFPVFVLPLAALGVYAVLAWAPAVSSLARWILVLGISVQVYRFARARTGWAVYPLRRVVGTSLLVAALGLGSSGLSWWRTSRKIPPSSMISRDAPSVLFLVLDAVGARWLSTYGYDRPTSPQLTALAEEGVLFERAYAPSSWSLPSHASMFTGRYEHDLGVDWWIPLDGTFPTLAERLSSAGYMTGGFMANQAYGAPSMGLGRGFQHYSVFPVSWGEVALSTSLGRIVQGWYPLRYLFGYWHPLTHRSAAHMNRDVLDWLERVDNHPFFAFVNYFDAHEPYFPPPPFDSLFAPGIDPLPAGVRLNARNTGVPNRLYTKNAEMVARMLKAYDGSVAYVDEQIGRLLQELEARGLLEHTIVLVTADHGEYRGEVGRFGHGAVPYASILHVPLILRYPRALPAGVRIADPVGLRDLPATVLDLAGLDSGLRLPGRSLRTFLSEDNPERRRRPVFASGFVRLGNNPYALTRPRVRTIIDGDDQLIQYDDGREALFELLPGQYEVENRLPAEGNDPRTEWLRAALDSAWQTARRAWPADSR